MRHSVALRNVILTDLDGYVRQQEVSSDNGILLWKITEFAKKRQDTVSGIHTDIILQPVLLYKSLWIQDVRTHLLEW